MVLKMTVSPGCGDCTRQGLHKGGGGGVLYKHLSSLGAVDAIYAALCKRLASRAILSFRHLGHSHSLHCAYSKLPPFCAVTTTQ